MAKRNTIEGIRRFAQLVDGEATERWGFNPTTQDLLYHLSERGLINPISIRNYLIVNDFYKQLKKNEGHMNHTFMDIAIEYNLSERQIQTIIYSYQKKFVKSANKNSTKTS